MRSRKAGTVFDWSFPESDSYVSHDVLSFLLWWFAEQTGYLRSKHWVKVKLHNVPMYIAQLKVHILW